MHEDLGSASPAPGPRAAQQRGAEQSGAGGESFVQSHFQAQYRSSLTCPHCRKQSNTFDPFLCISLPIPVRQTRALNVTLVLQREGGRSLRVGLAVPLLGTAAELREMVAREGDVPPQQVILAEVSPQGSLRSLDDSEELSTAGQGAPLYALQAPPDPPAGARPVLLLLLCHVAGTGPHRARFGPLLVLRAERGASWAQLQRDVLAPLRAVMRGAVQGTAPLFRIHVAGEPGAYLSPQDVHPLSHAAIDRALQQSPAGGPPHVALTVEWDVGTKERLFGSVQQEAVRDADSVRLQQAAHQQHSCTLDECFQLYTKEEQLAPDDAWRCPHCRVPQQGTVQLRLWTLPDILIIHLKRFRQVAQRRHKLSTLVCFPLRGLDMAPHLAPGGGRWQHPLRPPRGCPPDALYDLYAVCNHHGSMQGGHYTAYCCNSLDGRWYSYDDSTVEEVREDEPPLPAGSSSSASLNHWAARLGGPKQHSAESQPAAPQLSPPCSLDPGTAQEQGGFEARPSVRGVQSRSLSVKLPPPARCRAPPRAVPLRWSFTSRPRVAPGQLLPYIPVGPGDGSSPRVPPAELSSPQGDVVGSMQSTEPPLYNPAPRRAHSAGPGGIPCPKSPPGSGEQETEPPRGRREGPPRAQHGPRSPEEPIRRSQSSACLPPRPPHPMRRSASLGRGAGGTAGTRGRERVATLRRGAVPESSF
ncbi:ubiquitin carboxyl-terminal hydrolase 43 isoform X7 [Numida meleagris]|uniref:ubiquitin carboxyl-terminal hydrolase 43 isoform X7 n=1 Tax=Numida meleagris TaxID=8996 RepID=UPI000B3DB305|nr:ubiquitin carboxyl-terminal hydrolase 43 isoform X7 [Numida meleagris]